MKTSDALAAVGSKQVADGAAVRAVEAVTGWLSRRTSRRGFLVRAGVVGSALAMDPSGFLLKPGTAYASVCGPGSSCSSGWTVFCATINKGANACPPGSIAAGWWKSDGASLCGGKSRYIVDCNASCSCSTTAGRPGICSPSCWSCQCTCGPAGQCDQRRVCCNAFRYGQCNEQVRQVGAVQCRVVSCTPPWRWENCSTSPATDNATRDHNSPSLPSAYTAITARYIALGENGCLLGGTVGAELATPGGRAQRYQHGRMSWTTATGARYTDGAIMTRYVALGAESGSLGYPIADPHVMAEGPASQFQHGRISWTAATGAHEVTGAILTRYTQAGLEAGIGYPLTGLLAAADGQGWVSRFQRGRISWHPTLGAAKLIVGAIRTRYEALGSESGPMGYPVAEEVTAAGGQVARFQHGRICWTSETGAWAVRDLLDKAYERSGAEQGPLGFPVADERDLIHTVRILQFQHGRIASSVETGAHWVRGPIADHYVAAGAETGPFGLPVNDEHYRVGGIRRNDFRHGWIEYDEATGTITEHRS